MTPTGLPHSEIPGSKRVNRSPRLIAACRVLHRLPMPRHPPLALSSLSIKLDKTIRDSSSMAIEDKLSYCNPQGPVTLTMRWPHHKTGASVTPGGFRVTLLFDYQRTYQNDRGQRTEDRLQLTGLRHLCRCRLRGLQEPLKLKSLKKQAVFFLPNTTSRSDRAFCL